MLKDTKILANPKFLLLETEIKKQLNQIDHPHIIIFLKSDPQINIERLLRRGREYEKSLKNQDYLYSLNNYYKEFLKTLKNEYPHI